MAEQAVAISVQAFAVVAIRPRERKPTTGSCPSMQTTPSPITAEVLRQILADALEGGAARLRGENMEPAPTHTAAPTDEPVTPLELNVGRLTLSVDEAAERLGIGRSAAYEAIHRGEIPSLRIGRRFLVPVSALSRYLERDTTRQ
jgi:excisionase family DNA binding protein